ncbi:hypothetical protein [Fischerella thermalis]|nr:hypothetical protein [Fischerella thermalis]
MLSITPPARKANKSAIAPYYSSFFLLHVTSFLSVNPDYLTDALALGNG